MTDARNEIEWAAVTVAYGTGAENVKPEDRANHLLITDAEYRALGLHKSTVFKLDLGNSEAPSLGGRLFRNARLRPFSGPSCRLVK
jgi:hypothetical protein